MKGPSQPIWYGLLACLVSMVAIASATVVISDRTARESEQKWCRVLTVMTDSWKAAPPPSESGRRLAVEIARLRAEFGCPTG